MVQWSLRLTIAGLLAVSGFVASAQVSSPPTAALKATVDQLAQADVRAQERLNHLQDRVTILEGLKLETRLTVLEQYWLAAKQRDESQMTLLYSIAGGLVVLALGQYLNLKESVKHRRVQRGEDQ